MAEYELVREIQNSCSGNQMRDVFFEEIECDDPVEYVKSLLKADKAELTVEVKDADNLTIFADCSGMTQKFLFTRI
jgi:hypothetical protein